jgi:hypothetical protein
VASAKQAAHGFRRLVVGNLLQATGDLVAAASCVGDVDLNVLRRSYVMDRPAATAASRWGGLRRVEARTDASPNDNDEPTTDADPVNGSASEDSLRD